MAIELVDTTDKARAAFVRQYLGLQWQEPRLYHAMFNTDMGEACTATMLVECVQQFERGERSPWPEQTESGVTYRPVGAARKRVGV